MRSACAILLLGLIGSAVMGQPVPPGPRPQPIAWRERVFFIPFHVRPARDPRNTPTEVRLFVSTDRGQTWTAAGSADPRMRNFVFKAPSDGEYWFSIRTADLQGRLLPLGPFRAELSVLVDTEPPQLALNSVQGTAGEVHITWQATDPNLDPSSLQVSVRCGADGLWQPLAIGRPAQDADPRRQAGKAAWVPPIGCSTVLVRSEVRDRAGNPAVRQSTVATGSNAMAAARTGGGPVLSPDARPAGRPPNETAELNVPQLNASGQQPWPADQTTSAPFGDQPSDPRGLARGAGTLPDQQVDLGAGAAGQNGASPPPDGRSTRPRWTPVSQQTPLGPAISPTRPPGSTTIAGADRQLAAGMRPMLVATRTFDLEYDIAPVDSSGVAKVELWGTTDSGQTWSVYGHDDDCRSPIRVDVDGEGIVGLRIAVQSGSGRGGAPPVAGDQPEMWVGVDLTPPTARILSAGPAAGRASGQLEIDWQAYDDNLPPRPISLHYSGHPGGPWSMIAASLKNIGRYTWTVDRHVPEQVYLRLDVRDAAGNATTIRTSKPVTLTRPQPTGRIRSVRPIDQARR